MKTKKKQTNLLNSVQMYSLFALILVSIYTFWFNSIPILVEGTKNNEFYPLIVFVVSLFIGGIVGSIEYNKKNTFKENWKFIYLISTVISVFVFTLSMAIFTKGNYGFEKLQIFLVGCGLNVVWHNLSISLLTTCINKMIRR